MVDAYSLIQGSWCFFFVLFKITFPWNKVWLPKSEILASFRVDPKETIYTGVCPSESDVEEATNQESYCFCDQSSDCRPGNDVTSCPFEFDG